MTLLEQFERNIPAPYPYMYLDGYTPAQILHAVHRQMYQANLERREEQEAPTFNITTTVKVK